MRYVRSQLHKQDFKSLQSKPCVIRASKCAIRSESGSQIVGFALVAPFVIYLAVASIQLCTVAVQKVTVTTAVQTAAREFATRGGTSAAAQNIAERFTQIPGLRDCGQSLTFKRFRVNGLATVEAKLDRCIAVSALGKQIHLVASARTIDESKL